jgi:hypothetical protein
LVKRENFLREIFGTRAHVDATMAALCWVRPRDSESGAVGAFGSRSALRGRARGCIGTAFGGSGFNRSGRVGAAGVGDPKFTQWFGGARREVGESASAGGAGCCGCRMRGVNASEGRSCIGAWFSGGGAAGDSGAAAANVEGGVDSVERSDAELLLWATLMGRAEIAEFFWRR